MNRTTSAIALSLFLGLAPASAYAQQQDTQQQRSAGLLATEQQSLMVDSMVGANVYSAADDGETIGSIDDVVISVDGVVEGVIIGVGGWLGVGERDVLLPMTDLSLKAREDELRLVMQRSRDELEEEPQFRRANEQTYGVTGETGTTQPEAAAEYGVRQDQAQQDPMQQDLAEEDPMPEDAGQPEPDEEQIMFQDEDSILASTMIGTDVRVGGPEADEELGQISDVLVNMDGRVEGAVVGVGGWLGLGEKEVVVAMDRLDIRRTEDDVRVSVMETRESLEAAESFQQPRQQ